MQIERLGTESELDYHKRIIYGKLVDKTLADIDYSELAGLVYGQIGQTEYIIRQVKKESGFNDLKVVATGGLGRIISEETDEIDVYDGWTNKFIFPPYKYVIPDAAVSNFHLPESTMLMAVAAFGGYEKVMNAYRVALEEGYRFGPYGDALLIV